MDRVRELATPKDKVKLSSSELNQAKILMNGKYTQAEVAKELGISLSTLKNALK